jgi:broad specificity phosphatase PhoE
MIPARSFYMLRHGQTQANVEDRYAGGRVDTPLTDQGRDQAREAAGLVASLPVAPRVIVHSSLSRARDTARIVGAALNLPLVETDDLREQNGGLMEGQPFAAFRELVEQDKDPLGGESLPDFRARIRKGLSAALEAYPAPVLVVSHGGVFRAFGDLYGRVFRGVGNCHLYAFDPAPDRADFPWRVWHHEKTPQGQTRTERLFP